MSELTLAAIENALRAGTKSNSACLSTMKSMSNTSEDVQDLNQRLVFVDAIYQSLSSHLALTRRKQDFLDEWSEPAKEVLVALRDILLQIQERLGKAPARIKFWSKTPWPFEHHETVVLRRHLGAYTSLAVMVFDAWKETSISAVQSLSKHLKATKGHYGQLILSNIDRPAESSVESESGKQPQDIGPPSGNPCDCFTSTEWTTENEHIFKVISFRQRLHPEFSRESEDLGPGTIAIRYAFNGSGLWIFFWPESIELFEHRWFSKVCLQWAEMNREADHKFRTHRWQNYDKRSNPAISLMIALGDYVPDVPPKYGRMTVTENTLLLQFSSQKKVDTCWEALRVMWAQCGRNWKRQIEVLKEEQRRREEAGQIHEESEHTVDVEEQNDLVLDQTRGEQGLSVDDEELPPYSPADETIVNVDDSVIAAIIQASQSSDAR